MYELTPFLTAIAAASATIAAILGGFIGSKLISLHAELLEASEHLKQVEKELKDHYRAREAVKAANKGEDAYRLMRDAIVRLFNDNHDLSYSLKDYPSLDINDVSSYKDKTVKVFEACIDLAKDEGSSAFTEDEKFATLTQKFKEDDFSCKICRVIRDEVNKKFGSQERSSEKQDMEGGPLEELVFQTGQLLRCFEKMEYRTNSDSLTEESAQIELLNLRKADLERNLASLKSPADLRAMLIIFALFAFFCIVLPLVFIPYETESLLCFRVVKYGFLLLFVVGLIAIFIYLWRQLKRDGQTDE